MKSLLLPSSLTIQWNHCEIAEGIECSTSDLDPESSIIGQGPIDEPLAGNHDTIATSIEDKAEK